METDTVAADRWAATVAERWVARLAREPALRMCLPAGETPRPLYAAVAQRVAAGHASFREAQVFLLDEFALPPEHPARCERMLRRDLLDHVDLPPPRFHRLEPGAPDIDAECRRYGALVGAGGLDLVLLGLGHNGHIGLNEPGAARDSPTRRVDLHPPTIAAAGRYTDDDLPTWGLTLGLRELLAAREVWLLVTGGEKAAVLDRVLAGPIGPDVPASFLRDHPNASVIADDRARPR